MKEATSELSSAVIVVVSVAILVAFFYFTVWPMIDNNFKSQTSCEKALCSSKPDKDGFVECKYKNQTIKCKYKG